MKEVERMNMPLMLGVRETAKRAGVPEHALRRWIAEGRLHTVTSGNRFYISWASVVRFLEGAADAAE